MVSRRQVAELIGTQNEEVVLVPNATHGLNTVLRNIEWREGDIILGGEYLSSVYAVPCIKPTYPVTTSLDHL